MEIAGLILSPIIGSVLEKFGRKRLIIWGFVTITLGTIGLALIDLVANDNIFFILCILCRLVQGSGDQMIQTSIYSVVAITFSKEREKYIGYVELAAAFGLMFGPIVGGTLNYYFGYFPCYIIFSIILSSGGIINYFLLPSSLD